MHESIVPWIFRCYGDEPRQQRVFLDYVLDKLGRKRLAVLRTPGKPAHIHLEWWISQAQERGHPVVADLSSDPHLDKLDEAIAALKGSRVDAVLTWCDAETSASILRGMRDAGMEQLFVGGEQIVGDSFMKLVGDSPGEVVAAYPMTDRARRTVLSDFAEKYTEQSSPTARRNPPGPRAYLTYDATRHLLAAIDIAGPDREAVRRTLSSMSMNADGERHFEQTHSPGTPMCAILEQGEWKFRFLPRE
jgi:ABC-type branched-subunit amino acid transport system substrate-binding protein